MKKYLSNQTALSLKAHIHMSSFFPFYDSSGRKYLDFATKEGIIHDNKMLDGLIKFGLAENKIS